MRLNRILFSEKFIIFCLSIVILLLSFYSLFHNLRQAPMGTTFPLVHNNNEDYNFYIHLIRQAKEGDLLLSSRYTPEIFPERFIHLTFVTLGKIAYITDLSLPLVYNLARLILGISLLCLIYYLIKIVYPDNKEKRILAFFLSVFGSGFWTITKLSDGRLLVNRFLSFWTEIDVLERFTFIPHTIMAKVFMVLSILIFYKAIKQKNIRQLFVSVILAAISGFSNPFTLFNLIFIIVLFSIFTISFYGDKKTKTNILFFSCLFLLFSLPTMFYHLSLQQNIFPWNNYAAEAKIIYPITIQTFLLSLGPNFLLTLFALPFILKSKKLIFYLLLTWLLSPFIGIFVIAKFGLINNVRFLSSAYFIPLGILAAEGLTIIYYQLAKMLKVNKLFILTLLISLLLIIFSVDIYTLLKQQLTSFSPRLYNVYLSQDLLGAFQYLDKNTAKESIVLAQGFMGNLIPAYSHNRVVAGHRVATYRMEEKGQEVSRFFEQNDISFSKTLLQKYQVSYIFFGPDTPPPNMSFLSQLNFEKIFENNSAMIYQVMDSDN